jgi:hypothetical protein
MKWRLHTGTAAALFLLLGGTLGALADESAFKLENQATNQCIRFDPPSAGMIIAGRLRTLFCHDIPEQWLYMENNLSYSSLKFHLGVGDRCIHVRAIDMQTLPGDIYANECQSGTSVWNMVPAGPPGLVTIHLWAVVNPDSHCLAVDRITTRIKIAECANTPEQQWRKVAQ